jgi:hypothetical protein
MYDKTQRIAVTYLGWDSALNLRFYLLQHTHTIIYVIALAPLALRISIVRHVQTNRYVCLVILKLLVRLLVLVPAKGKTSNLEVAPTHRRKSTTKLSPFLAPPLGNLNL